MRKLLLSAVLLLNSLSGQTQRINGFDVPEYVNFSEEALQQSPPPMPDSLARLQVNQLFESGELKHAVNPLDLQRNNPKLNIGNRAITPAVGVGLMLRQFSPYYIDGVLGPAVTDAADQWQWYSGCSVQLHDTVFWTYPQWGTWQWANTHQRALVAQIFISMTHQWTQQTYAYYFAMRQVYGTPYPGTDPSQIALINRIISENDAVVNALNGGYGIYTTYVSILVSGVAPMYPDYAFMNGCFAY